GLGVADFADHYLVRIVTQNASQPASKCQSLFLVHRNLRNALELILDRVLDRDYLVLFVLYFIKRSIQRCSLTGTRRPGHQHHPVRLGNEFPELLQVLRRESDNVQIQFSKGLVDLFLVENTNDYVLAVNRRHDRHAEIDLSAANHYSESSVLRYAALGNVQLRHDLDALNDGLVMGDVYRVCRAIERAVNSVFDHHVRVARFYVNIRSSPFE